jgi:DNA processing protein
MDMDSIFLRLMLSAGIGQRTAFQLLKAVEHTKDYTAIFTHPQNCNVRLTQQQKDTLKQLPTAWDNYLNLHQNWLNASENHHFIHMYDAHYPAQLFDLSDPPIALYVQAKPQNLNMLKCVGVGIVGSRQATHNGLNTAHQFAQQLAEQGFCIISGLADGIDAKAHQGALQHAIKNVQNNQQYITTVAVVGTGIDIVYPNKNKALAQQIAEYGCIVSDFVLGVSPQPSNFPRRNRLIAALSKGVIVVEANLQSGSLITARLANEIGRDVFAIPGSIFAPSSKGCHALIRQGAILLDDTQQIIDEWWLSSSTTKVKVKFNVIEDAQDIQSKNNITLTSNTLDTKQQIEQQTQLSFLSQNMDLDIKNHSPSNTNNNSSNNVYKVILGLMDYEPLHLDTLKQRSNMDEQTLQSTLLMMEMDGIVIRLAGGNYQKII